MITVQVLINGHTIFARSARRVKEPQTIKGEALYKCDTGDKIVHCPNDGFIPLVIKMLQTIDAEDI